jgi:hypothetical protein
VIESADEFVRLRASDDHAEYSRAAHEGATMATWFEVIDRYPDMGFWVAQNKSVPLPVLEVLRHDADPQVRSMVRAKGTWRRAHPEDAKRQGDPE